MAGPFFNVIGGKYVDLTAPVRFVHADLFAVTHSTAENGILADHRTGGALLASEMKRAGDLNGTRLRCWIKCSADATVSYVRTRNATPDTFKPAGSMKVTALAMYVFELPFTALDESFDVFIDTAATVSLVVEEV
jgi:hypothetical protein